jgi:hypothetical protein
VSLLWNLLLVIFKADTLKSEVSCEYIE